MPKELSGLTDRILSHWFPTGKSSHVGAGGKTKLTVKETWGEGPSQTQT